MNVTLDPITGHVTLTDVRDGSPWRASIDPHDACTLDALAPDLDPAMRAAIMEDWAGRPVLTVDD